MVSIRKATNDIFARCGINQSTASENYTLAVIGTLYPIKNNIALLDAKFFTGTTDGLKFTGTSGTWVDFDGTANVESDKAATVTFELYVNGVLKIGTPVEYVSAGIAAPRQFAASTRIQLNNDDEIIIKAKSDTTNTTITIYTLGCTIGGFLAEV